ncbi:hypothetical protein ACF0H5_013549 [Mactra antiquata]
MSLLLSLLFLYNVNCFDYKTCDNIKSFVQFENKPLNLCADECSRRQRCKQFMFRKHMNYCALKEEVNVTSLQDGDPYCVYYTHDEWVPDDIGSCRGQPCGLTERCNSKTKTEFKCVKSECPSPAQIQNAHSLSNMHTIGSTNRYKCSTGIKGQGNPTITCLENATWSITDFKCVRETPALVLSDMVCPAPKVSYYNADLTKIKEKANGEIVLTYSCRNGYMKNGNEVTITCKLTGVWTPKHIACCPDNSTHFLRKTCKTPVDGGLVTTEKEAKAYCKDIGGWMTFVHRNEVDVFNKSKTRFLLQLTQIRYLNKNNWYEECAASNGAVADPKDTLREKIDEVLKNNWKSGGSCYWAYSWIAGEPTYGENENCIFRDTNESNEYKQLDGECTFSPNVGFLCELKTPDVVDV